ncbi:MAG: phage tail protein [Clostridia bacterium]|nr:phage tail protein [Clostridia bacterium]
MSDVATTGIQNLGTEVLTTTGSNVGPGGLSAPLRGFRFTADFEGLGTTSFKSVSGFGSTVDVQEYREGGFGFLTKRKLPGLVNYDEITLEKGLYSNPLLYNFFSDYLEGQTFKPVNAVITVFDNAGSPTASWQVINAWPSSYKSSDLSAEDSSILIETLTLQHEGIKRDITATAG